jgi:ketosteroid isomerase-like protein
MKLCRPKCARALVLLTVLFSLFGVAAHADDYSDVAQLTREGKFSEALGRADRFLSNKPRDAQMRLLKGVTQRDSGKTADAIATFVRLTEEFPDLPEPHNNLGVIYADQNQIDKARASFEAALRTHPSYSTAHENLGDLYAKLSSTAYSKALQIEGVSAAVTPKLTLSRQLAGPGQVKIVTVAPSITSAPAAAPIAPPAPVREPATQAKPEPIPPPARAVNDAATREAEAAVQNWAAAWSSKDLKAYFNAYSKDFDPAGGASRSAWEAERRARIEGKSKISVRLEGLQVVVNGNKATAKFRQDYRANGIAISSRKTLELVKRGDSWKITREAVGG